MFTKTCFKIYLDKDNFCQYIFLYLFAIVFKQAFKNIFSPLRISIQENKLTCHITLFILVKFTIFSIQYNA